MTVIEFGKTALPNVRNDGEIPVSYALYRDEYTIFATIDTSSIRPSIVFEVERTDLRSARLDGESIECYASFTRIRPTESAKVGFGSATLRFTWNPSQHVECDDIRSAGPAPSSLSLRVVSESDQATTATENLAFEILPNGIYREYEGI